MSFIIPNAADANNSNQAEPDSRDFRDILALSHYAHGILESGECEVTAQTTPDMTVAVAAGNPRVGGRRVAVTQGNVTITAAHATLERIDLVCVDNTGTKSAVAGTAAANPVHPDPAGKLVLATVYVTANETAINTADIDDRRILIADPGYEDPRWYGASIDGSTDDATELAAAIAAAVASYGTGKVRWYGDMALASAITISSPVILEGAGASVDWNNVNKGTWAPVAKLIRTGATTTAVLIITGPDNGIQLRNFGIDGGAVALYGIDANQMQGGVISNVGIRNLNATTGIGIRCHSDSASSDVGFEGNIVENIFIRAPNPFYLDGNAGGDSNVTHNAFRNLLLLYGDATNNNPGIDFQDGDGNVFENVWMYREAGTGYGLHLRADARQNVFVHLDPGLGGVRQETPTTSTWRNFILFHNRGNSAPAISEATARSIEYVEIGPNADGWQLQLIKNKLLVGEGTDATFLTGDKGIHIRTNQAGEDAEIRLEPTQNSTGSYVEIGAQGSASEDRRARLAVQPDGELQVNSVSGGGFVVLRTINTKRVVVPQAGGLVIGDQSTALGTTATDGFLYIPTCAGTPTGTPTTQTGTIPLVFDTTNDVLYLYEGGAWQPIYVPVLKHITFSVSGNLSTGTGTFRWYNDEGRAITIVSTRGSVGTAPTTQSILIDINENGTSIWNTTQANRITIGAGTNTDEGGTPDDASIADGNYLTVDIDQVGSGTVGADLTVTVWYK